MTEGELFDSERAKYRTLLRAWATEVPVMFFEESTPAISVTQPHAVGTQGSTMTVTSPPLVKFVLECSACGHRQEVTRSIVPKRAHTYAERLGQPLVGPNVCTHLKAMHSAHWPENVYKVYQLEMVAGEPPAKEES